MNALENHLFGDGPKRILALDGGGIRGVISLQILKRIETLIRLQNGPRTRLCDYFDLIGGTSTGAIIAGGLALGWEVDKIINIYRNLGQYVFQSEFFRRGLLRPKFDCETLEQELLKNFGSITIGSDKLQTGLAIVLKRLDTGSPWVVTNNPRGKYYGQRPGRPTIPNSQYLLRNVVRASTAAPVYFEPESLAISPDKNGAFVDGGVSPHNNPSLLMFMQATLSGYDLNWSTGEDNILLVSVGTGSAELKLATADVMDFSPAELGVRSLVSLMNDASTLNETLLQWISTSRTARSIDRQIGDLGQDLLTNVPLLRYLRYDVRIEQCWLEEQLDITLRPDEIQALARMERAENIQRLTEIGCVAGQRLVDSADFPAIFQLQNTARTALPV